jgi:hypothetical protein
MKMTTICSNMAHNSILSVDSTHRIFPKSRGEHSLPNLVFGALYLSSYADLALDLLGKVVELV